MILQSLMRFAEQEGLVDDPDYEFRRISWQINLSVTGKLLEIRSFRINLNEGTDRKPKYVGKWSSVPKQPTRTSGAKAFFLVDKCEYTLGIDPVGTRKTKILEERSGLFREQIQAFADESKSKNANIVCKFLSELNQHQSSIKNMPALSEMEPNDLLAFAVNGEWLHSDPAAKSYWSILRQEPSIDESDVAVHYQCLVTGEKISQIPLFPLTKKVPGGTSSGVSLVSHNSKAFCSYGLEGNENAPLSRIVAETCGVALTRLLDTTFPNPSNLEEALPTRVIRLGSNTAVCFWARDCNKESTGFLNALANLIAGDSEDKVGSVFQSIWAGRPVQLKKPNEFYALTISGTQGRAIVRDWLEASLENVIKNLALHFNDFNICRNTKPKKGSQPSPAIPMNWLLKSLTGEGRSDSVPPTVESGFIRSAIKGTPYPLQLLQRALLRTRAEVGGDEWSDSMRRDARAAVIKAVLNRKRRRLLKSNPESVSYPEVDVEMNPNLNNPGYTLGMLTAVLERLQLLALGDVNASLVDRFFSAASANPRSVFVRLLKNSQHHYRKARSSYKKDVRDEAHAMERIKDKLLSLFPVAVQEVINLPRPAGNSKVAPYPCNSGIPLHLDLENQGLFVLGYHQMRHWMSLEDDELTEWKTKYPDASNVFLWKNQEKAENEPAGLATSE